MTLAACSGGEQSRLTGTVFLLATSEGLAEVSLEGERRELISFDDRSYVLDPAISPDGRRLAFIIQPPASVKPDGSVDFGSDLYVSDRNGRNMRELVKHGDVAEFLRTPAWLTNDELLVSIRGRDSIGLADLRIEKVNVRTGATERFIDRAVDPALSRDRQTLAYISIDPLTQEEELVVAGADNANPRSIVTRDNHLALIGSVVFSPDGRRIAFAAVDLLEDADPSPGGSTPPRGANAMRAVVHPFAQDVWIVNVDGTGLKRLADLAENMPSLAWSHDGSLLYVLGPNALWRLEVATGIAEPIGGGIPLAQIVLVP